MRTRDTLIILLIPFGLWAGCSGKTSSTEPPPATTTGGAGGSSPVDASPCPDDARVLTGLESCRAALATCGTGACFRASGQWSCTTGCPCASSDDECLAVGGATICVPAHLAVCLVVDGGSGGAGAGGGGVGGGGGTGGFGGSSGFGGAGGFGGSGAAGGAAGAGGTGQCNGYPACNGSLINFCSEDQSTLLSCGANYDCPAVTPCSSLCPACACHMVPPVNGALDGTCDTCTTDSQCDPGLVCRDNPMYPGSGARTCVLGN